MNRPFHRAMAWSVMIHFGVLFLFSVSNLFVPRSTGPWTAIEWRPVTSTIEILPRIPGPLELRIPNSGVESTTDGSYPSVRDRRRSLGPIPMEESRWAEEGIQYPSRGLSLGDVPDSLDPRRQGKPVRSARGDIPVTGKVDPASIPVPSGLVIEWKHPPATGAAGVSASSLGVEGSSALTTRAVLSHAWPEVRQGPVPHEPVVFRFAVTSDGRVKRVIPETLEDPTWVETASECLLRWRFAPLPGRKETETWGRIRM